MIKDFFRQLEPLMNAENRKVILNLLEKDSSAKVIDLGCSDGSFTKELGKRIGTTQLYGVDIVEESIQQAEKNGVKVYLADLNDPFSINDEAFDVVHANAVIEHICRTDTFIKQIHRILKRGGYAVISTPNLAAFHNIVSLLLGFQPGTVMVSDEIELGNNPLCPAHRVKRSSNPNYQGHKRIFTYGALKDLFEYHGFKVERIVGVGYYPFPVNVARILSRIDPRHAVCLTMKVRKKVGGKS